MKPLRLPHLGSDVSNASSANQYESVFWRAEETLKRLTPTLVLLLLRQARVKYLWPDPVSSHLRPGNGTMIWHNLTSNASRLNTGDSSSYHVFHLGSKNCQTCPEIGNQEI